MEGHTFVTDWLSSEGILLFSKEILRVGLRKIDDPFASLIKNGVKNRARGKVRSMLPMMK